MRANHRSAVLRRAAKFRPQKLGPALKRLTYVNAALGLKANTSLMLHWPSQGKMVCKSMTSQDTPSFSCAMVATSLITWTCKAEWIRLNLASAQKKKQQHCSNTSRNSNHPSSFKEQSRGFPLTSSHVNMFLHSLHTGTQNLFIQTCSEKKPVASNQQVFCPPVYQTV